MNPLAAIAASLHRTTVWCRSCSNARLRASEPFAFATGYFGMNDKTVEAWRKLWFIQTGALTGN
jgi:hypothetical protein